MNPYFCHDSAYVDDGAVLGEGTKVWHFSHVMSGARLGENCNLGQNVHIAGDTLIGYFLAEHEVDPLYASRHALQALAFFKEHCGNDERADDKDQDGYKRNQDRPFDGVDPEPLQPRKMSNCKTHQFFDQVTFLTCRGAILLQL